MLINVVKLFSHKSSHFLDHTTLHTIFVIFSTSPSPSHYLHLTIFTSPYTASSNLTASLWTSLLHPSSLALPSSFLHPSSISLPPSSSSLGFSPLSSLHRAILTSSFQRFQRSQSETGDGTNKYAGPLHFSLVAITVNHNLNLWMVN